MVRYRCPSVSLSSINNTTQANTDLRPSQTTVHGNGESSKGVKPDTDIKSKRRRSGVDHAKLQEIEMAKRREAIRRRVKARGFCHVYVGNASVESTVTERTLYDMFSRCGKITRIQIRCSRGCAVTIGRPIASHVKTERDRQYATIEFVDHICVRKALCLDGRVLHHAPIIVSVSAADLPEVKDVVVRRIKALQQPYNDPFFPTPRSTRLQKELTEIASNSTRNPKADKHMFMGISFPKCVM